MNQARRVVVIGGGISGLTSAFSILADSPIPVELTVLEAGSRVGGVIKTSPFAGLDAVDEAADAFLVRVPYAIQLAADLGLSGALTSPTGAHAYVWHNQLHRIPGDLLLGVPAKMRAFAATPLISPLAKLRAAVEPLLPRSKNDDSLGKYVARRFGQQINDRLVDPLVGSIYAADTNSFSLQAVPQIAALARQRSLLLAAAKARAASPPPGRVFASPMRGMGSMIDTLHERLQALGANIHLNSAVTSIQPSGAGYIVHASNGSTYEADALVVASPARKSAEFLRDLSSYSADLLAQWQHASVIMVTMAVDAAQWPQNLDGSGYLVPKPDQRWVTAASFASNKWEHWNPEGKFVLRVSLGRDGMDVMHFDDDAVLNLTLADLKHHLGIDFTPTDVRISRWSESFPQYRPWHHDTLAKVESGLAASAPGVVFAGASYRGIGIPACIQQARAASEAVVAHLTSLTN